METQKILIVGGTGFIGANLARFFYSKGYDIAVTLRNQSNRWRIDDIEKDINVFQLDITDASQVSAIFRTYRPNIILHTAVYGGYHFERDVRKIFDVNLIGISNILEAFVRSNAEILINAGSSSEYGLRDTPMSEKDILEPLGPYAVSKAAATLYSRSKAVETNRNIITLRLFSPYGYFEESHRLIPYLLSSIIKGETPEMNDPNNVRDFIFIEDVCRAYELVINNTDRIDIGGIFNLGSGKETKVEEIINTINKIADTKLNIDWRYGNERMGDKASCWVADMSKTNKILNWKSRYSLEEGLSKTYYWFKRNISKYEVIENSKARKYSK